MLGSLAALGLLGVASLSVSSPDPSFIDVARQYGAVGDGASDATAAIQKALDEHTGSGRVLYLRPGVYLVSKPLRYALGEGRWGFTHLRGAGKDKTILRLKDGSFPDPSAPQPLLTLGRHGSADWFHNSVQDLSLDTGSGNSGAVGIEFFSNNTGVLRGVKITSQDGGGRIGLDLAHGDMNGPLLVTQVEISGFQIGIRAGYSVNSQTLEHIKISGPKKVGLQNGGQALSVRRLTVTGSGVPVDNVGGYSHLALVDSRLEGAGPAAILNSGHLLVKNVEAPGFDSVILQDGKPQLKGRAPLWSTQSSGPSVQTLSAVEPPVVPREGRTVRVTDFGAVPSDSQDDAAAIQRALDSGASQVSLPSGSYLISVPLRIPRTVVRLDGQNATLLVTDGFEQKAQPMVMLEGSGGAFVLESLVTGYHGGPLFFMQNTSTRPLVLRDLAINLQGAAAYRGKGRGQVFIENVVGGDWLFEGQSVWARQFNVENEGTKVRNAGGKLWILGLKTERGGTLIDTTQGGVTTLLGGLTYTTTAGKLAPMFTVAEGGVLAASITEACYSGDPFTSILRADRTLTPADFPSRANGAAIAWLTARSNR
jgi:hypothetical protein